MSRPKNVLWIMCDQLRYDYLGCTGHPTLKTPNIDAMAKRGVRFSNAYVQSPICGPSRMSFYTGRYMRSHGSHWNGWPLRVGEPTLGDHLNKIGVRNVLVGKTHMTPDLEGLKMLGIAPDSVIGVHVAECGFEPYERDDGLHPTGRPRPKYDAYLRERGYDAANPWEHWANSGADEDGTLAERLAAGACRQGRPRGGRGFRDALHDPPRDGFHHRGRSRRTALVPASVLHQAALALHRARALRQHVWPRRRAAGGAFGAGKAIGASGIRRLYGHALLPQHVARRGAGESHSDLYGPDQADRRPDGRADGFSRSARPARHHHDRVHLRSRRLSRRSLDGREGPVPRCLRENPADRDRSVRRRPTPRGARSATRWSRRSIWRRPSSSISAASRRITFWKDAR